MSTAWARAAPPRREILLAGAALVVFAPALGALAEVWSREPHLGHGFLVPAVAGALAWRERARLRATPRRREPRALPALAAALLLHALATLAGSVTLQGLTLVATLAAGVAWSGGLARLRVLAFPLAYLLFMVPPPASWITPLIVRLQGDVSAAAVAVAHAFGLPVLREGNVLVLAGGDRLFVEEACSGITSIVTLLPLGVLLAALGLRRRPARVLLVAAVAPLAMLGNLVRVVATLHIADAVGAQTATTGALHALLGLSTYAVACGLLLGLAAALRRREAP